MNKAKSENIGDDANDYMGCNGSAIRYAKSKKITIMLRDAL